MTTTQAALLEAQSIRAIVAKMRADLTAVGGFDNELLGVPAGGVRAHIEALEAALRAAEAAQPEPVAYLARSRYGSQCHFGMKAAADAWAGDGGEVFEIPLRHLGLVSPSLAQPAPIAAQPDAPTIEAAHDMGAKGGPTVDAERLAFEAWMRGHCWALCATWTGTQYRSDAEQGGDVDPRAMRTRQLWAAWRDRAALAAQAGPAQAPLTDEAQAGPMTAGRASYFMERFLHDEKMLGPNEQAALRYVIGLLEALDRPKEECGAPASTRPADASSSGQRVGMVPSIQEILTLAHAYADAKLRRYGIPFCQNPPDPDAAFNALHKAIEALAAAPQAPAEQPSDVFSLMLHSKPRHEDAPENALVDMPPPVLTESEQHAAVKRALARASTPVAPAEPAAQAVDSSSASGRTIADAVAWIEQRRDDFIAEHGATDPDTGALEFGRGAHAEAKVEYVGELNEIIEGLRALAATPAAREALPVHEVWREGYRITGESEGAVKLGEAQAATFKEACDIVCRCYTNYDPMRRTVWGCRLFNNEADARKAFG